MSLLNEINKRVRDAADAQHVQAMCEAVREGLAPFNVQRVEISVISTYGWPSSLRIETDILKGQICLVDIGEDVEMNQARICAEIKQFFRNIYVQPEGHIQLGLE